MSFSTPHVLVIVKANGCGACKQFASVYPDIGKTLEASGVKVGKIVEVTLPSLSAASLGAEYPKSLYSYLAFFPAVILVPRANWDAAVSRPSVRLPLEGRVVNGKVEQDRDGREVLVQAPSAVRLLQKDSLVAWIKKAAEDINERKTQTPPSFVPPPSSSESSSSSSLPAYTPPTHCTVGQFLPYGRYY